MDSTNEQTRQCQKCVILIVALFVVLSVMFIRWVITLPGFYWDVIAFGLLAVAFALIIIFLYIISKPNPCP